MIALYIIDDLIFKDNSIKIAKNIEKKSSIDYYIWYRLKYFDYNKVSLFRDSLKNSKLILSENYDLAIRLGYNGVHFNKNSYRCINIKNNIIVGYSAHSLEEIYSLSADYYTLSPIFESKYNQKLLDLKGNLFKDKVVFALGGVNFGDFKFLKEYDFKGPAGIRLSLNPK